MAIKYIAKRMFARRGPTAAEVLKNSRLSEQEPE
jgi:hypothetical protein